MSETGKPLEIERKYLIKMPSEKLLAELPDISARVDLPPQIELVKDVTGDRRFNNSELAGLGHFPPL